MVSAARTVHISSEHTSHRTWVTRDTVSVLSS
jgi:hypothetical protein